MKFLIVIDMQVDFIGGSLGSEQAKAIVPFVVEKVKGFDGVTLYTRDTHESDYLSRQEGRKLPVEHCIRGTKGWEICDELKPYAEKIVDKPTFGAVALPDILKEYGEVDEIEICGLCTDICVISNAIILKSAFPDAKVIVDGKCSAGVTMESHNNALNAMRAVQIEIKE